MTKTNVTGQRRLKLVPEIEGPVARWYARIRSSKPQLRVYHAQAAELTEGLPDGAHILEVAPGPGFLAIELARLGRFTVTGLDIGRTFVEIASENARKAVVSVDFRHGDVARMPFAAESFDLIICQAAFKNFTRPADALAEMHRVLCAGGTAIIQDLRAEISQTDIAEAVAAMGLSKVNSMMTKLTLTWLRRRAYSRDRFKRLAAASPFRTYEIRPNGIGIEVKLTKD
ncbi:MAG: class I SAM-dependent methyltransferase [Pseudonocardia sp.]|nr:class I SAM-dependent methyltransferase [Pseudonocardia sp.]